MAESSEIQLLIKAVDNLSDNHKDTNKKVDMLVTSNQSIAVILEKLSNIEIRHIDHHKSTHKRIDREVESLHEKVETAVSDREKDIISIKSILADINIVVFMSRHPKIFGLTIGSAYLFTIKDFRDPFLRMLGVL